MKKLLFLPLIALIIGLSSCGSKNPVDKTVSVIDDAIEQINKTDDATQIYKIMDEVQEKLAEISEKNPDFKPTDEQSQLLQSKAVELMQVAVPKLMAAKGSVTPSVAGPDVPQENVNATVED